MSLPAGLEREVGHAGAAPQWVVGSNVTAYGIDDSQEYIPALMWPESTRTYGRMANDPKIAGVLRAVMLPILRAGRSLDPNGASPEIAQLVSESLGVHVKGEDPKPAGRTRDRFSLTDHMRLALRAAMVYGFMPFEQNYRIIEGPGRSYAQLRKLAPRMPITVSSIETARDGGLVGIRQVPLGWAGLTAAPLATDPLIKVDRLVMYSHDREGSAWQGRSLLRHAYRPWKLKDEGLRGWATSMRRNGLGQPVYHGAQGETDPQLAKGAAMAQAARSGETAGAAVPYGASLTFEGVRGTLPDHLAFVRYQDEEIAGGVLAEFLKLGSSDTGSRALGDAFVDFFVLALQAEADWFLSTFNEHVIEDLVDVNGWEDQPAPRLLLDEIGTRHEITAEAIARLVQAGAFTHDPALENELRRRYGMPKLDESTVVAPVVPLRPAARAHLPRGTVRPVSSASPGMSREPNAVEAAASTDFDRIGNQWQDALDALLAAWGTTVRPAQVQALLEEIQTAADTDDLVALSTLTAPTGTGTDLLAAQMRALAELAAAEAAAEAGRQGVSLEPAAVADIEDQLIVRAAAVDELLAAGLAQAASTQALLRYGTGTTAGQLVTEISEHLDGLSDRWLSDHLGGALTAAQNTARVATFAQQPPQRIYASELLDKVTCENCAEIDEHEFPTLAAAELAYPTGGYKDCLGGPRCRGTLVAVYGESAPSVAASVPDSSAALTSLGEAIRDGLASLGEALASRETPTIVVNPPPAAAAPNVTVEPAQITVQVPQPTVTVQAAAGQRPMRKRVVRDANGDITETIEEPV